MRTTINLYGDPIFRCHTPPALAGYEISRLDESNFYCDDGERGTDEEYGSEVKLMRLLVMVFGMLSMFFIGLAIAAFLQRDKLLSWANRRRGTGSIYYVKAKEGPNSEMMDI